MSHEQERKNKCKLSPSSISQGICSVMSVSQVKKGTLAFDLLLTFLLPDRAKAMWQNVNNYSSQLRSNSQNTKVP